MRNANKTLPSIPPSTETVLTTPRNQFFYLSLRGCLVPPSTETVPSRQTSAVLPPNTGDIGTI